MAFSRKSFVFGVISFAALGLVACGDDSGNGFVPTNGDQVSSIYELGQCSAEKEGISVLVTGENTYYLCTSAEWKPVAEYNGPASSSTLTTSSSSAPIEDPSSSSSSVIASSSGTNQSSSSVAGKPAWQYLNPDIDYGEFTDARDDQVYKTVTIGTQTWMAENLNYAYIGVKFNYNGNTSDSTSWCYDNDPANCEKYGRLYTWAAVMDSAAQFSVNAGTECGYDKTCTPNSPHRGICPEGWHVPTDEEYSTLYYNIGSPSTAGSLLKSTSGWSGGGNGSDKYGFSALPAGFRHYDGIFEDEGGYTTLWSASENNGSYACFQYFYYPNGYASQYYNEKFLGMSLRCLKD